MENIKRFLLLSLIGVVLFYPLLNLGYTYYHHGVDHERSVAWIKIPATTSLSSNPAPGQWSKTPRGGFLAKKMFVSYEYSIKGQTYTGCTVDFNHRCDAVELKGSYAFEGGQAITVYVNPMDIKESVINRDMQNENYVSALVGWLLFYGFGILLFREIFKEKKPSLKR